MGSILRSRRSPGGGNGKALQYSCLENPMDRGAWWATVHGVLRVGYNWATECTHNLPVLTGKGVVYVWETLMLRKLGFDFLWSFSAVPLGLANSPGWELWEEGHWGELQTPPGWLMIGDWHSGSSKDSRKEGDKSLPAILRTPRATTMPHAVQGCTGWGIQQRRYL